MNTPKTRTDPIEDTDFWKRRIERADAVGVENYSVYILNENAWHAIAHKHRQIIEKECTDKKVLDAGCGYGRACEWIEDYTGVDFSPDFIARAQKKYPDRKFLVANLKALPFADNEFDIAIAISMRHMVLKNLGEDDWNAIAFELKRVAKRVIVLEYLEPDTFDVL